MSANATLKVPSISCNHCVMTIQRELAEVKGIESVSADAEAKTVAVEWDEAALGLATIRSKLAEIGYPPQGEE